MGLETPFTGKFIDDLREDWPVGADDAKSQGDDHIRGIKQVLQNQFPQLSEAVTANETELNYLDTATPGTAVASKALVVDANLDIDLGAGDLSATLVNGITTTELDMLSGRTLTSTDDKIDNFPSGTKAVFWQDQAPTGWAKDTSTSGLDGATVRFETSTAGQAPAGTDDVTSPPSTAHTHTGTASGTTGATAPGVPAHNHYSGMGLIGSSDLGVYGLTSAGLAGAASHWTDESNGTPTLQAITSTTGPGSNHTHSFSDGFTTSGASNTAQFKPKYINCIIAVKS